jgi:hypothetical protein
MTLSIGLGLWSGISMITTFMVWYGQPSHWISKVLKPVDALFRRNGIRCCYYIDDSLIMNQDFEKCTPETAFVASEMDKLGFTENMKKSVFQPTQRNVFFFLVW